MKQVKAINFLLFGASVVCFLYLFYVQCIKYRHYADAARQEHMKKVILLGNRGNIYDRNGLPLATSEPCYSVFCTPRYSVDKAELARELTRLAGQSREAMKGLVDAGKFFWVEKKVDVAKKDRYVALDDPAIGFAHDLNRQYNMPEIFAGLTGRCGTDNQGLEGLELYFNEFLAGKSGFVVYQKDPNGEIFPSFNYPEKKPESGQDIFLTIDLQLQAILYSNLKEYLSREEANGASGLIIDPRNGEILAMVNIAAGESSRNGVVCDEFEPGSTFKIVPLAFALVNGSRPNDKIDTEGGRIKVGGHTIHDFKNYGTLSLRQAIAHSSNVAMVKLGRTFNRRDFSAFIRDFGFTELTGLEFPGEAKGRLARPEAMREIEFSNLVFGQGITCNLIQLAFSYQAIANRGVLNKPLLVKEIKNRQQTVYRSRSLRVRRVIDDGVAGKITDILCSVVDEGSGAEAHVEGVKIAGKTGTAQKAVNGQYSNSRIIATFVGYFPADDPSYLVAVMLDEPKKGLWASTIAAPIFKRVAQSICQISNGQYAVK